MRKITIIFINLLIILYLPATLFAAKKTITTYTWDKNINVSLSAPTSICTGTCNNGVCTGGTGTCPGDNTCTGTCNNGVCTGGTGTCPPPPPTPPMIPTEPTPTTPAPAPVVTSTPAITIDTTTQAIVLGSGATGTDGSGALWYGGTSPAGTCNPCTAGVCTFGVGLRAYFEVKFTTPDSSSNSTAQGDGFSFIMMNAVNNDATKRGGSPSTAASMGELIGHAGSGNTKTTSTAPLNDGLGLEPPKMALEFDTYPNTAALTYNGCTGGRADSANNHLSLMFWGLDPASTTMCDPASTAGNAYPRASFDDNVHGVGTAGSTTVPRNSITGDGTGGYYERAKGASTYNWLEDDQYHRVRIEVIRTSSAQTYRVKAWVDCETLASPYTACPANEYIYFQDIYNPYNNSLYLPKIDRNVTLSTALNTMLDNILFGFTEGTGAATQRIQITNVATYFPTIAISPTSASHTHLLATGQTVSVAAASSSCTWTAVSNNTSWLTVTSPASGTTVVTDSGTVTYSVAANTGSARTGTITIGGQIFTVTQTGCAYSLSSSSYAAAAGGATGRTVSVTATTGCPWTASTTDAWITVSTASGTGTGSAQTVTYSVAANATGSTRTGTITIGGQFFTVTQVSCAYTLSSTTYTAPAAGTTSTQHVSVTTTTGCPWTAVSNVAWITRTAPTGTITGSSGTTVDFTVAANTTGSTRTGTMTIAGQTFTVTQATQCTYVVTVDACHQVRSTSADRINISAHVTGGTPSTVSWSITGPNNQSGNGTLTWQTQNSSNHWGGDRNDCGIPRAARWTNATDTAGAYTVSVTASGGACLSGSGSQTLNY